MKILIDTNIFLDVLLKREKYFRNSLRLLQLCIDEPYNFQGFVSATSIINIDYISRKANAEKEIISNFLNDIIENFEIVEVNNYLMKEALNLDLNDLEDSLQAVCAISNECEFLVTRNLKDFKNIRKLVVLPEDLI